MPRGRPSKYTVRQRFMIEVLHLHGLSAEGIARIMARYGVPMTRKSVQRQVWSLPHKAGALPADVRQRLLDALRKERQDFAHGQPGLPSEFFKVKADG